jgi:hypothetical protein
MSSIAKTIRKLRDRARRPTGPNDHEAALAAAKAQALMRQHPRTVALAIGELLRQHFPEREIVVRRHPYSPSPPLGFLVQGVVTYRVSKHNGKDDRAIITIELKM